MRRGGERGERPRLWVYDRTGQAIMDGIDLWFPGAVSLHANDVAIYESGDAVVSARAWSEERTRAAVFLFVNRQGGLNKVVRTEGYLADFLTIAGDGSIWSFGRSITADLKLQKPPTAPVVQRFDRGGRFLGTVLTWGDFDLKSHPSGAGEEGIPGVVASRDRVGVYCSKSREWFEFNLDGRLREKIKVEQPAAVVAGIPEPAREFWLLRIAMTASNEVYGFFEGADNRGVFRLDRSSRSWAPVPKDNFGSFARFLGTDGDDLIMRSGSMCGRFSVGPPVGSRDRR